MEKKRSAMVVVVGRGSGGRGGVREEGGSSSSSSSSSSDSEDSSSSGSSSGSSSAMDDTPYQEAEQGAEKGEVVAVEERSNDIVQVAVMMESVKNNVNSSYMYTFVYCRHCNLMLFI